MLPIVPPDYPQPLRSLEGHVAEDPSLYWRDCAELGTIFDAAALGQYLGGVDPRNRPQPSHGFINESCLFDPRVLKPRMEIGADGLHIHCKDMRKFMSRR